MNILLDMDGVLCDFNLSVQKIFNKEPDWSGYKTSIVNALGITSDQLWKEVNKQKEKFWEDLPKFSWTDKLVNAMFAYTENVYICSSPGMLSATTVQGKVLWLNKYFPKQFRKNFVLTPQKHLLANIDTILVDDTEEKCNEFIERGGHAVLFPQKSNKNRWYEGDKVEFVMNSIDKIIKGMHK